MFSTETVPIDRLIGGSFPLIGRDVTLTDLGSAGALPRGAVLGMVTTSGKYGLSDDGASDGSEIPRAILALPADPSAGDVVATVYEFGVFNETELFFGGTHDADSVREALRSVFLFVRTPHYV